jgi:ubiquitin carboxyl-terminal hydrolase 2/21
LFNNRYQKNDIIKIDVENLKNKYSVKKDLEKISENQNIPELITNSLTGLVNLGETCYMNTGLQNLIHCVPFINELFSSINDFEDKLEEKPITNSFYNLCLSLIKYDNYNLKFNFNSYNPILFRKSFCRSHKQYSDNEQHDSLEFLRILLDDISKELNQTKVISKYKEISTEGKSKEQQNKEYNDFYLCRENSIVVKIFYSQIMNEFICECGDISYSFEKILDIPLLFPKEINEKEINLNDLISNYFEGEDITWNLVCQKCSKKDLKRNKKIKMTILPNVLIFSLQRFNPITGVKINKTIKFEETIDLKSFCDFDFFNGGEINTKYRLFGISNHSGTINYGHYYSCTKVGDNWYEFNDSLVKPINLPLMSRAAYFFFYEKKE